MNKYIYFDNAATTYPKPECVTRAVRECIEDYCANPGRSTHKLAVRSAEAVYETREQVADLIGSTTPERIVFQTNATYALNTAIRGLIDHKCHIITSDIEHNSVTRPLHRVCTEYGCEVSVYNSDLPLRDSITPLIREDTEFIVSSIASNLTGKVIDIAELSDIAREFGLKTIIDASQYLGHLPIDLSSTPFDVICAPGHKALFGIQGSGFLHVRSGIIFKPLVDGGGGSDTFNPEMPEYLPDRFEAGTLNTPAIVSLGEGIKYLKRIGIKRVKNKIEEMTSRLKTVLEDTGARIYGCNNGIASFMLDGLSPAKLSRILDDHGIATRSGLHCAPGVHKRLGTEKRGLVRISLSVMNSKEEIDILKEVLLDLAK